MLNDKSQQLLQQQYLPTVGKSKLLNFIHRRLPVLYYVLFIWFRKPEPPSSHSFSYHLQSQAKMITIVLSIIITIEGIGVHFLLTLWNEVVAWIVLALNVYGIFYLIALNQSMRHLPISLTNEYLVIQLGILSRVVIPISEIAGVEKAKELDFGQKEPKDMYCAYLKIDSPQFAIKLKSPFKIKDALSGKKLVNVIVIRVDNPQMFLDELKAAITYHEDRLAKPQDEH